MEIGYNVRDVFNSTAIITRGERYYYMCGFHAASGSSRCVMDRGNGKEQLYLRSDWSDCSIRDKADIYIYIG